MAEVSPPDPSSPHPTSGTVSLAGRGLCAALLLVVPFLLPVQGPVAQMVVPGLLVSLMEGVALGRAVAVILAAGAGGLGVLGLTGNLGAVAWLGEIVGLGVALRACRHYGWPGPKAVMAGYVYLLLGFLAVLILSSPVGLAAAYGDLKQAVSKDLEESLVLYRQIGAEGSDLAEFEAWLAAWRGLLLRFLPGCIGLSLLFVAVTNVSIARFVLIRRQAVTAFGPAFRHCRLPEPLVWGVIGAGALALAGGDCLRAVGENILVVCGGIYYLQGLAVIAFHLVRLGVPAPVRVLSYVLLSVQWYGLLLLVFVGLADVWFDLRKLTQPGSPTSTAV